MTRLNPAIPLTPEGFQELCGVSDDDLGRLGAYVALL